MKKFHLFLLPSILSLIALGSVYGFLGPEAFITATLLAVLEVTLSFDNAVVNARVLGNMSPAWQNRFLTWGILFAVVGTRVILPLLIVSLSVWLSPLAVAALALFEPETYAELLEHAHHAISAFGGIFLLMVALKYFFDTGKDVHWIKRIERHLSRWGRIEAVEIAVALLLLVAAASFVPGEAATILTAGIIGMVCFIAIQGITSSLSTPGSASVGARGLVLFLYLNVLDAAFSLDSVIGAFAITTALPVIIVGLGIGAYFVRTLTVYLVREKVLESLVYIEHGAHWAILGLAGTMLASLLISVPEPITGFIGIAFIFASLYSSLALRKKTRA